jgi:galactose oxidase
MQFHILRLSAIASLSSRLASALSPVNILNDPGMVTPPVAAPADVANVVANIHSSFVDNGNINTDGITTLDGVPLRAIPEGRSAVSLMAAAIAPANNWIAFADSYQPGYPASNVLDGNVNSFWHTPFGATGNALPHYITIDMAQTQTGVNQVAYIPRQDGQSNGNIGEHKIDTSIDGVNWNPVSAIGTYQDSASTKTTFFEAINCRFVRLTAYTEAGARGPWSSIASLNIFQATPDQLPVNHNYQGQWSPTIDFPLVPVSMALEHNSGKVLVWSSYAASTFGGSNGGNTLTATFDPTTQKVSQRNVQNTDHDMFCEGLSMDVNGRFISTGGNNAPKTSIYDPNTDMWSAQAEMNIPRGYQSMATLSNGNAFTIGGSWSGGNTVAKNGEVYNPTANTWTLLNGAPVAPMLTADQQGVYRADNHGWLFGWKAGTVFQAGPSRAMNWYDTAGGGSTTPAGARGVDGDAMCGNAVMYDAAAGKILTVGGATSYQGANATANAHVLSINAQTVPVNVQPINPMWFPRIFANAVVLPNGQVFITGGQIFGQPFSDDTAQIQPELWDPVSTRFVKVQQQTVPRTYHSTAILLPDATVLSGGGGLCGACATNHYDAQVFTPPYLFNAQTNLPITDAQRPHILGPVPAQMFITTPASNLQVTADGAGYSWSVIRLGSTTHTVNTDQRRIPLFGPSQAGNGGYVYSLSLPTDPGIMLPGYYMLFAINGAGVPSRASYVQAPVP